MAIKVTPKSSDGAGAQAELGSLLGKIPVRDLASKLNTDEATASNALTAALPALLAKLQDNASSADGASSLASALSRHNNDLARGNAVNLDQVDTRDGQNILRHVFGNQQQQVTQQLADNTSGASKGLLDSLLPMLAPIAMSFLSNQLSGGKQASSSQLQGQQDGGFDIGGLLGGLLGGRQAGQSTSNDGGLDIGGLLGGLFGKRS